MLVDLQIQASFSDCDLENISGWEEFRSKAPHLILFAWQASLHVCPIAYFAGLFLANFLFFFTLWKTDTELFDMNDLRSFSALLELLG